MTQPDQSASAREHAEQTVARMKEEWAAPLREALERLRKTLEAKRAFDEKGELRPKQ